eukprot:2062971-Prymnesium_polylepis.1
MPTPGLRSPPIMSWGPKPTGCALCRGPQPFVAAPAAFPAWIARFRIHRSPSVPESVEVVGHGQIGSQDALEFRPE